MTASTALGKQPVRAPPALPLRHRARWRRLAASTSFKLGLVYAFIFTASTAGVLASIYWTSTHYMQRQTEASVAAEIELLRERYQTKGLRPLVALIEERIRQRGELVYILAGPLGYPVAGNISGWPAHADNEGEWLSFEILRPGENERASDSAITRAVPHRVYAKTYALTGGFNLLVGRDRHELLAIQANLRQAIWLGLAIAIVLGLAGAAVTATSTVRRVEGMHRTCRDIMQGDLSKRIALSGADDDFDQLSLSINDMLAHIEDSMDKVKRVSDSIAHDLRTPLTRLRSRLEIMQQQSTRTGDADNAARHASSDWAQSAEQALAEVERLLGTFNALLRIARLENEPPRAPAQDAIEPIDLASLLSDVSELYEPLANEKNVQLLLEIGPGPGDSLVLAAGADANMVFQMLANLVDNAVKFSPPDTVVKLRATGAELECVVEIIDAGPGIPRDERQQVFERFYRSESARASAGNGLGLSLVAAVANRYGIQLSLHDASPGLRVRLVFRRSGSPGQCTEPTGALSHSAAVAVPTRLD